MRDRGISDVTLPSMGGGGSAMPRAVSSGMCSDSLWMQRSTLTRCASASAVRSGLGPVARNRRYIKAASSQSPWSRYAWARLNSSAGLGAIAYAWVNATIALA